MPLLNPNTVFSKRYRLTKHLGTGAFAEVWKAEDTLASNTIVAIKIYAPDKGMDQDGIQIFRNEYALPSQLKHTNLLNAKHFDVYNGSPYLVMDYCSDGSLMRKLVNRHEFSEAEVAKIIHQIGSALAYVHRKGLCHKDIKPENILIYDSTTFVLGDFGISTRIRRTMAHNMASAPSDQKYTSFTPAFAPPESNIRVPAPSGDVFSFGATLYEVTAGSLPFEQMGRAIQEGAIIPPIPNKYSRDLNEVVMRCMRLEPEQRPTADDLDDWGRFYLKNGYWNLDGNAMPPNHIQQQGNNSGMYGNNRNSNSGMYGNNNNSGMYAGGGQQPPPEDSTQRVPNLDEVMGNQPMNYPANNTGGGQYQDGGGANYNDPPVFDNDPIDDYIDPEPVVSEQYTHRTELIGAANFGDSDYEEGDAYSAGEYGDVKDPYVVEDKSQHDNDGYAVEDDLVDVAPPPPKKKAKKKGGSKLPLLLGALLGLLVLGAGGFWFLSGGDDSSGSSGGKNGAKPKIGSYEGPSARTFFANSNDLGSVKQSHVDAMRNYFGMTGLDPEEWKYESSIATKSATGELITYKNLHIVDFGMDNYSQKSFACIFSNKVKNDKRLVVFSFDKNNEPIVEEDLKCDDCTTVKVVNKGDVIEVENAKGEVKKHKAKHEELVVKRNGSSGKKKSLVYKNESKNQIEYWSW